MTFNKVTHADMKFYQGCMILKWGIEDIGFGQFTFYPDEVDGRLRIDNEAMNKETVKLVMDYAIEEAMK